MLKKLLSFSLITIIISIASNIFASEIVKKNISVIKDKSEIDYILKEKNIYNKDENILTLIELKIEPPDKLKNKPSPKLLSYIINREIYTKYIYSQSETETNEKYRQNYPAGFFDFEQNFKANWELEDNLGLSTEKFETALCINLNDSKTNTFTYHSDNYNCPITVLVYPNYEKEYYDVYDKDLMYDDYIGQTHIKRKTGYYVKIIEQ